MGLKDSIRKLSSSLGINRAEKSPDVSEDEQELDFSKLQESASESDLDSDSEDEEESEQDDDSQHEEEEDEEDEEEDVPLSDAELDDDADVVPHQKMTINNQAALKRSLKSIELPQAAKANFVEHLSITAPAGLELRDVYDDTERELAFYKQSLDAAVEARKLAKKNQIPFSRPVDFFAEMLKSDEHMAKVKSKLVDKERQKMGSQEARKQRELKKYGKKVQHERLQQRQKEKRDMLDKINGLKRKRKEGNADDDEFGVQIEDALTDKRKARDDKYKLGNQTKKQPNRKRIAKNNRYGSGHKRGERSNTKESSMDVSGFRNRRKH